MTKNENLTALIDKAIAGDRDSLETVILSVRDLQPVPTDAGHISRCGEILHQCDAAMSGYGRPSGLCAGNYAIQSHRLNPAELDYTAALKAPVDVEKSLGFKNAMEQIDDLSAHFTFSRLYESPEQIKRFITEFLESTTLSTVKNA